MGHALAVRVAGPCEAEHGLNHVGEVLAGRHLDANTGVLAVARIPPVVPLRPARRRPSCPHGGQSSARRASRLLTRKHGEALNESEPSR